MEENLSLGPQKSSASSPFSYCAVCPAKHCWGGDIAQLADRRTGTPPTQVRFSGAASDFFPRVNFNADSLTVSVHLRVQSHAFTSMRTLKIP